MVCDIRKWAKWENVIIGHCDSCHSVTLFCLQILGVCPRYPNHCAQLCLYQSLFTPWWEKKSKNGHFIMEVLVFNTGTKNVENAIFQFSTWFLKSFPLTEMGPLYLKKNCKPSSTRIYYNLPSWPTHGRVIALAKCNQCGWTVGICLYQWFWQKVLLKLSFWSS